MKKNGIFLILLGLILIILMIVAVIYWKKNSNNSATNTANVVTNNTSSNTNFGNQEKVDADTEANKEFAIKFIKMENKKKNIIYSPLSIKYALNLLNEGANGKTKEEIEKVIKGLTLTQYKNVKDVLSLANSVYIRDTYSKYVKDEYKNNVSEKYNSEIQFDAFKNAKNVNAWIEKKTFGIINNMLEDKIVQNPNTEMLLINALAIDMEWDSPFKDESTSGGKFTLENGKEVEATTMYKEASTDSISFYKDDKVTSVTMDLKEYDDNQLEFVAIMPSEKLSDYINDFSAEELAKITKGSKSSADVKDGIQLYIPKFSFEYDLSLKDDLMDMGILDAFDDANADFSNMTDNANGLCVGDALHKANIEFSEEGVKAAAVTVMVMVDKAMAFEEKHPEVLKFDKPFLYVIRDKENGEIWFIGAVYEPNLWEDDKADYKNVY